MLGDYGARRGLKFQGDGIEAWIRSNNGMSELEEHFNLGSGWPLQNDEPSVNRGIGRSPWFGLAPFIAFASLLIAISNCSTARRVAAGVLRRRVGV
jgi:hypothetical protein